MSKLASHIAVFCSHDNTGSKLIQSLNWIKINSPHFKYSDLFVRNVISNPPIRTGLDFKSAHFDPVKLPVNTEALGRCSVTG
jgi:hypothetical protein